MKNITGVISVFGFCICFIQRIRLSFRSKVLGSVSHCFLALKLTLILTILATVAYTQQHVNVTMDLVHINALKARIVPGDTVKITSKDNPGDTLIGIVRPNGKLDVPENELKKWGSGESKGKLESKGVSQKVSVEPKEKRITIEPDSLSVTIKVVDANDTTIFLPNMPMQFKIATIGFARSPVSNPQGRIELKIPPDESYPIKLSYCTTKENYSPNCTRDMWDTLEVFAGRDDYVIALRKVERVDTITATVVNADNPKELLKNVAIQFVFSYCHTEKSPNDTFYIYTFYSDSTTGNIALPIPPGCLNASLKWTCLDQNFKEQPWPANPVVSDLLKNRRRRFEIDLVKVTK